MSLVQHADATCLLVKLSLTFAADNQGSQYQETTSEGTHFLFFLLDLWVPWEVLVSCKIYIRCKFTLGCGYVYVFVGKI